MDQHRHAILVVDDIGANREILVRRFERRGYEVVEADGGSRALELIGQRVFDIVLLDVDMPDLNGFEVLKQIRQQHSASSLPVIMVTGKSGGEDIAMALAAGANDYVTKRVDFVVALARTTAQLGRKRAEDAVLDANETLRRMNETLERRVGERTSELVGANEKLQEEIAERERSEAASHYIAHHDALTGLGNRVL